MRLIFVLIISLFTAACTTTQSSESIIPESNRTFSKPYADVFQASLDALRAQDWRILDVDKQNGIIKAAAPASIWTLGDEVIVFVSKRKDKVSVEVDSSSAQAYDWGKGEDNISNFYTSLKNRLQ